VERPGYLVLGRLVRPHGVRGELKLLVAAAPWEPFSGLRRLWVGPPGGPYRPYHVEEARGREPMVLLKLEGVESPEDAGRLVGQEAAIPRAEAPPPPEGQFYHYDIVGLEVVQAGRPLGEVREILEMPAHDVYVVQGPAGEWMLPATRTHIAAIDLAAGRIELSPDADVAGLLSGGEEAPEAV
jgi:16S rRNA processing protein RimM